MVLRTIPFLALFVLVGLGCATSSEPPETPSEDDEVQTTLTFTADDGIRMENASNPGAKVVDGEIQLLYEMQGGNRGGHAIAVASEDSDWLDFSTAAGTQEDQDVFRAHQLPDGTWRTYGLDTTKGVMGTCLQSSFSEDGVTFTSETGCRYTLQDDDNGRMGVYDFFNDESGGVTLLYIGDLMGKNNVRRAYSTDNGETFTFQNDNVLGDENAGGGSRSYVDQKTIRLDDERLLLVAMKEGKIYGFTSDDDGESFDALGVILRPEDFDLENRVSLHDPQIVQLPDGRYRIYVTIGVVDGASSRSLKTSHIVSATTE